MILPIILFFYLLYNSNPFKQSMKRMKWYFHIHLVYFAIIFLYLVISGPKWHIIAGVCFAHDQPEFNSQHPLQYPEHQQEWSLVTEPGVSLNTIGCEPKAKQTKTISKQNFVVCVFSLIYLLYIYFNLVKIIDLLTFIFSYLGIPI